MSTTHVVRDTVALTDRSLRHIARSPDTIITTAVTPIALMALFVFVFGGAIDTGGVSYIDYMLPGILLITIASGIAYTAYRLFLDLQGGIFERFQSMPIARASSLWAHVLTSLVANIIVSFLHGLPPGFLVSITDSIAAIIIGIIAVIWGIVVLVGALTAIVRSLKVA